MGENVFAYSQSYSYCFYVYKIIRNVVLFCFLISQKEDIMTSNIKEPYRANKW